MRFQYFLFACLLCSPLFLSAQITVTAATFPSAGDTLRLATDLQPSGLVPGAVGGPQIWDFTSLQADNTNDVAFQDADEATDFANFPSAQLFSGNGLQDRFYRKSNTQFLDLGYAGAALNGTTFGIVVYNNPALPERRAPMNIFDFNTVESSQAFAIPISDLIDSLIPDLAFLDSIRFITNTTRFDVVDGFGTCILPAGSFEVLRETRTAISKSSVEVHSFLGWVDLTTLISGGGGVLEGIGIDTTITYLFMSNTEKAPIAELVTSANGNVRSAQFKRDAPTNAVFAPRGLQGSMTLSPNPADEQVQLRLSDVPAGRYQLRIVNSLGQLLAVDVIEITGDLSFNIETAAWIPGLYYCVLVHETSGLLTVPVVVGH